MPVLEELERLSDERFLSIYEALAQRGYGPLDGEVAKALKFRPQAIRKLPMEKRAQRARKILSGQTNAELCYELFGRYLVGTKQELVTSFLDATGVAHEDGMIEDVETGIPDPDKVEEAVAGLDEQFDPEDVTLYLALAAEQWPDSEAVVGAWRART